MVAAQAGAWICSVRPHNSTTREDYAESVPKKTPDEVYRDNLPVLPTGGRGPTHLITNSEHRQRYLIEIEDEHGKTARSLPMQKVGDRAPPRKPKFGKGCSFMVSTVKTDGPKHPTPFGGRTIAHDNLFQTTFVLPLRNQTLEEHQCPFIRRD